MSTNPYLRDPRDGAGSLLGPTGPITTAVLFVGAMIGWTLWQGIKALAKY